MMIQQGIPTVTLRLNVMRTRPLLPIDHVVVSMTIAGAGASNKTEINFY